jgi:hypothetical protein
MPILGGSVRNDAAARTLLSRGCEESLVTHDTEHLDNLDKQGLPLRERNADMPEHTSNDALWMGIIAVLAMVALLTFGTSHVNDTTASNGGLNT